MIRTRHNSKTKAVIFYDSDTGAEIKSINTVSFQSKPGVVSTVITKDGELYTYYPESDGQAKLVKLYDLINFQGEIVEKVG